MDSAAFPDRHPDEVVDSTRGVCVSLKTEAHAAQKTPILHRPEGGRRVAGACFVDSKLSSPPRQAVGPKR